MKSMTGYAKEQCEIEGLRINIEIKTLNSKQLDINTKIPPRYRSLDFELRTMLAQLGRGKIDFILSEEVADSAAGAPNNELITSRYKALSELLGQMNLPTDRLMDSILAQGDVWNVSSDKELEPESIEKLAAAVRAAVEATDRFRQEEGAVLQRDFDKHIDLIEQKLGEIPAYEQQRIETAKTRIRKYMADFAITNVDENRFEQELIYYLEKLDITEEKVRLQKHIDYFRTTMREEDGSGKKLGFIAQEMGREINTIGSKANQVDIQRLVVVMKDELEKIKEQLGNIL
ncbi:MAG: YicC family protein [Bacteroidales bacterium]|nr:YicC family protein [Bacteroidales bacterium]